MRACIEMPCILVVKSYMQSFSFIRFKWFQVFWDYIRFWIFYLRIFMCDWPKDLSFRLKIKLMNISGRNVSKGIFRYLKVNNWLYNIKISDKGLNQRLHPIVSSFLFITQNVSQFLHQNRTNKLERLRLWGESVWNQVNNWSIVIIDLLWSYLNHKSII